MFISFRILFLISIFLYTPIQSAILHLRDYNESLIKDHWKDVQSSIIIAEQLIIQYSALSEHSLHKILSLSLPNLKALSFGNHHFDATQPSSLFKTQHHQYLTHQLLKTIFHSPYLVELNQLNLVGTNLDDRFWNFLPEMEWKGKKIKISKLFLGSNQIGRKGFHNIAQVPFSQLQQLDVSGNLLIEPQSVTSLIQLLCGPGVLTCRKQLKSLDVSSTNIRADDLIRLLRVIDSDSLIALNISNLNLHLRNKYHEGYDLQAYQFISNLSFTKLIQLEMNDLALDETVLQLFQNCIFPSLQSLSLFKNFINDKALRWITKANFPKLNRLILFATDITNEGLDFIAGQQFQLRELNVGMTKLSKQGLKLLDKLDGSRLQKIFLKSLSIETQTLKHFFINNQFQHLKQLSLSNNKEISDLFNYFPWNKMKVLEKFILTDSSIQASFTTLLMQNKTLLPNLRYLMLNGTSISSTDIEEFISSSYRLFPKLQYVNVIPESYLGINFTTLSFKHPSKVKVELGYISFLLGRQKVMIQEIKSFSWLALYSSKYDLSPYLQPITEHFRSSDQAQIKNKTISNQLLDNIVVELNSLFSLKETGLIAVTKQTQWRILINWIKQENITILPSLASLFLSIPLQIKQIVRFLNTVSMPFLRNLRLGQVKIQQSDSINTLSEPLKKLTNLIDFKIKVSYSGQSRQKNYNSFFNKLKYPFLMQLDLSENYFQTEQIGGIIYNHSQTLRFLKFHQNFIEKSFLKMLAQCEVTLKELDISFVSFPVQQFSYLGKANTNFIADLRADKCDLTDEHMIALVQSSNSTHLFPKLGLLSLNQNQIHEKGFQVLFEKSLYHLISIRIKRNYNPHFLNMMLTYTTKITEIVAVDVDIYALATNIHPISTRRIQVFAIQTYSFSNKDFEILGSLDFQRLKLAQIETKNVYDCEILVSLLKICSRARFVWVTFKGDQQKLNSTCLRSSSAYSNFESEIEQIGIWELTDQIYIPQFVELLLTSQRNWRKIILKNLRLPPTIFTKINPQNLDQAKMLFLGQNYLDDNGLARILQSPLQNLIYFSISNCDVSIKSLSLLSNRTFNFLEQLDLSGLQLGQAGVKVLASLRAPKLKLLILDRCDIKSLKLFHQLYFPQVYQIYLRYNYITATQLLLFLQNFNRSSLPNLKSIDANGIGLSVFEFQKITQLSKQTKITLSLDPPHYLDMINSASY